MWLVIALPALGAVLLLVGGAIAPKAFDRFGHLLGCAAADRVVRDQPG